jgi:hypothetical protein
VLIANAPQASTETISITGQANANLTAPTGLTGALAPYNGITIMEDPASTNTISIVGQGSLTMTGTLYAPKALLKLDGNGSATVSAFSEGRLSLGGVVVVFDTTVTGNGDLTINADPAPSFQLATNHAAGLTADSTGLLASRSGLRAGPLVVAVEDAGGTLTADQQARIADAISSLDSVLSPLGVDLVEATAADSVAATIHLDIAGTTDFGGVAAGVLGVTENLDTITIVSGWNWYTGADPSAIGQGQYDFETVVAHELGHVLGLGESSDPTSVMYGYLASGAARRTLSVGDLGVIDSVVTVGPLAAPVDTSRPPANPGLGVPPASEVLIGLGMGGGTVRLDGEMMDTAPEATAVYGGDPNFDASTSPALNEVINQDATTTALSVSGNPAVAGQPLTLTATVTPAVPGFGPPTSSVLFLDGSATIGTGTLDGSGVATFTTAALAAGTHSLTAVYVGDANFTGSSTPSPLADVVNNPTPVVTSLGPPMAPEGSPAFTLTLSGSNFLAGATVKWNGTPLAVTAAGTSQIQVTVPASLLADEGTALVTVTNPGPGGGASLPQTFTVADAGLTASGANISVLGNKNFSGAVATFTDANPAATAADFKAIITWDDGTATFGTVAGTGPGGTGPFTVSGTHKFGGFADTHTVSVTIFGKGGTSVTLTDNVIDPPAPADPAAAPAGNPAAVPAVLPMDELFAALETAMQARRHPHGHATGGHHPGHHAHPRAHRRAGGEGRA